MATQAPLPLLANGELLPTVIGPLPVIANTEMVVANSVVLIFVHPRAKSLRVLFEGSPGKISTAPQTFTQPMVEPFISVAADTSFTLDVSELVPELAGFRVVFISFDAVFPVPNTERVHGICEG